MLVAMLMLMSAEFAIHAIDRGFSLSSSAEALYSRLYHAGAEFSNLAIYGHMIVGGVLTLLVPLQLLHPVRNSAPALHRIAGYVIAALALLTSVGGLIYILLNGTIGGWPMTVGFGLYGVLLAVSAVQTVRYARARDPAHRAWALRLVILALGSWLYRVHYGLWYMITGGAYTSPDFSGAFDVAQTVMFYLPYLVLLELWLRWRGRVAPRGSPFDSPA